MGTEPLVLMARKVKLQMRNDLIKDFANPCNKRIDDLTVQHHGLSQRVAQLESCQHVIVDEARRGQDRGETLRTEVHHLKRDLSTLEQANMEKMRSGSLTRLRAATIKEFDIVTRLETQAVDAYNDAHQENPQVQYPDRIVGVLVTGQCRVPTIQTAQGTVEVPQVQFLDRMAGVPVVIQRQAPQETIEVPKTVSQDRIPQRTTEQVMDTPVPQVAKEIIEMFNVFLQSRVQQRMVEQITETPAVFLAEETVETPKTQTLEKIIYCLRENQCEFSEERQRHASHKRIQECIVQETDVPVPHMMEKTIEVMKLIPQERVQNRTVEQVIDVPVLQIQETVEVPQIQLIDEVVDVPVVVQRQVPTVEKVQKTVKVRQVQFIDKVVDAPVIVQRQVPAIQVAQKTVKDPQTQSIVKELRSKFEVGHTNKVHARNQLDMNRWRKKQGLEATQYPQDMQERADPTNQRQVPAIRSVQKTVEVPRVQYIDKVADIPVDVQRQVSTIQAAQHDMQHIDEVVHVPAPMESEVPNIPDADDLCLDETAEEDRLEQASKKMKLPMPAEVVSESRADESDFDRFDDLVLPSPAGKTIFMSIASGDGEEDGPEKEQEMTRKLVQGGEAMLVDETDGQSPGRELVQVMHAEWTQELREVRKKFADDMASEMTDVKNDLAHVRELLGVLVRRERCAETKTEIAVRRLDRMEREQHEADDAEHEANLQDPLSSQSKAVKVLVDKWFVDKGHGFGKAPTGEVVFIHAGAVQGVEVLTIGTDAWVQVVSDDARAQGGGGIEQRESGGEKRGRPRGTKRTRTKWPNK